MLVLWLAAGVVAGNAVEPEAVVEQTRGGGAGKRKRRNLPNIYFAPAFKPDPVLEPEEDKVPAPAMQDKPGTVVRHGILHVPLIESAMPTAPSVDFAPVIEDNDDEDVLELLLVA
jgi:hypothetical protein